MSNKTLTPVDEFSDAKSVVNGDSDDAALDEDCYQRLANRTHFLQQRRKDAPSSSAADAIASLGAAIIGDTDWHDSTIVTKSITGRAAGDVACVMCALSALPTNMADQSVDFRLKVVDNGVTSYIDGAAQRILANATAARIVLSGKHTFASASAVVTLQVKNSNATVSTTLQGGWNLMTW